MENKWYGDLRFRSLAGEGDIEEHLQKYGGIEYVILQDHEQRIDKLDRTDPQSIQITEQDIAFQRQNINDKDNKNRRNVESKHGNTD